MTDGVLRVLDEQERLRCESREDVNVQRAQLGYDELSAILDAREDYDAHLHNNAARLRRLVRALLAEREAAGAEATAVSDFYGDRISRRDLEMAEDARLQAFHETQAALREFETVTGVEGANEENR